MKNLIIILIAFFFACNTDILQEQPPQIDCMIKSAAIIKDTIYKVGEFINPYSLDTLVLLFQRNNDTSGSGGYYYYPKHRQKMISPIGNHGVHILRTQGKINSNYEPQ